MEWQKAGFKDRLRGFEEAVGLSVARFPAPAGTSDNLRAVCVAPEYAFAGVDDGNPVPAEPASLAEMLLLMNTMERLSRENPGLLLIPGSFLYTSDTGSVQNRSVGYFNGESIIYVGKRHGVGEVDDNGNKQFVAGNGGANVVLSGVSISLQICRDATQHSDLNRGDIQVIVGQGVGNAAVVGAAPEHARIIADPGNSEVIGYNNTTVTTHSGLRQRDIIDISFYEISY